MQDMQAAYILVASDPIDLDDLCEHLSADGLAVLNTTKSNAGSVANVARQRLGIDDSGETLNHLSVEVPGEGWWHFLCYSAASPVSATRAEPLIVDAVRIWLAKGSPAYFVTRIPPYALSDLLSFGKATQLAIA